ncbi:MAG: hypothetical protein AAGK23_02895 [Pseudomonadota bacterium]
MFNFKALWKWIAAAIAFGVLGIALPAQFSGSGDAEAQGRRGSTYYAAIVLRGMSVTEKGLSFRAMGPVLEGVQGECPHAPVYFESSIRRIYNASATGQGVGQISGVTLASDFELVLPLSHPNYDMLSRQIQSYADNGYNKATSIGLTYKPTGENCEAQIVGIGIGNHPPMTNS